MRVIFVFFILLFLQNTFAWIVKNDSGKCSDGGEMFTPDRLLSWETAKCSMVSETKTKTVLNCQSEIKALKGKINLYASIKDCEADGGKFNENSKYIIEPSRQIVV